MSDSSSFGDLDVEEDTITNVVPASIQENYPSEISRISHIVENKSDSENDHPLLQETPPQRKEESLTPERQDLTSKSGEQIPEPTSPEATQSNPVQPSLLSSPSAAHSQLPPSPSYSNVPKRLYKYQQDVQEKISKLKSEQRAEVMKHCSFKPDINHSHTKRSFAEFLRTQLAFESRKKAKIEDMKEALDKETHRQSRPLILAKSSRMAMDKRSAEPVYDQLYNRARSPSVDSCATEEAPAFNFVPTINSRPRKVKRKQNINEHLYNDAMRRLDRSPLPPQSRCSSTSRVINKQSEKYRIEKLHKEFNTLFESLDVPKKGTIPYSLYIILLQGMDFILNNPHLSSFCDERFEAVRAWKSLVAPQEKQVDQEKLLEFLLGVMNYSADRAVHEEYSLFYINKLHLAGRAPQFPQDFSFKPSLSATTIELARTRKNERSGLSNFEFLMQERQKLQEKWKRMKMEREKEEIKGLTFTPKTNRAILTKGNQYKTGSIAYHWKHLRDQDTYSTHRSLKLYCLSVAMKEDAAQRAADEEAGASNEPNRELHRDPRNIKSTYPNKKHVREARGVSDVIKRLRDARKERERVQSFLERGNLSTESTKQLKFEVERKSRGLSSFREGSHKKKSLHSTSVLPHSMHLSATFRHFEESDENPETSSYTAYSQLEGEDERMKLCVKLPSGEVKDFIISSRDKLPVEIEEFIQENGLDEEVAEALRSNILIQEG